MKVISFRQLIDRAAGVFKRFPLASASSVAASAALCLAVQLDCNVDKSFWLIRLSIFLALGISLFLALSLFAESKKMGRAAAFAVTLTGFIPLALLYLGFNPRDSKDIFDTLLFFIISHLLVSFAGFSRRGTEPQFWEFNKTIFLRLLQAALFTAVLIGGIDLAMNGIDNLLGVKIHPKVFTEVNIMIGGVFSTLFFLAGVPSIRDDSAAEEISYPRGLKLFACYVLLPLSAVYLVILYLYAARIIINWELPSGWVSGLIIAFSAIGIFAYLLVFPVSSTSGRAVALFFKGLFAALAPILVLLWIAVTRRIWDYGITHPRYYLIALTLWLTLLTAHFLISERKNIKVMPLSFAVFALLATIGPWNVWNVSLESQRGKFVDYARKFGIVGNFHSGTQTTLKKKDYDRFISIAKYIRQTGGSVYLSDIMKNDLAINLKADTIKSDYSFASALNISEETELKNSRHYYFSYANSTSYLPVNISGFAYSTIFKYDRLDTLKFSRYGLSTGRAYFKFTYSPDNLAIIINSGEKEWALPVIKPCHSLINSRDKGSSLEPQEFFLKSQDGRVAFWIQELSIDTDSRGRLQVSSVTGIMFVTNHI